MRNEDEEIHNEKLFLNKGTSPLKMFTPVATDPSNSRVESSKDIKFFILGKFGDDGFDGFDSDSSS